MASTQLPSSEKSGERNHLSNEYLYETDFVKWIDKTAELLKQGKFSELDLENLIEEVESLGRHEKNALRSNLRVLLMHLLKWQYQPSKRSNSWRGTIIEHRIRIQDTLEDSPSLKNFYPQIFDKTYQQARNKAAEETGLPLETFPVESPYTSEQMLDAEFLPEE
ncbi:DUF29 domain-containing protein [Acaryochloris marina]|uniref:DUF29 domain-containing protein n=1 Tax=Acaryochloris marina (strain MBIC 11017) TaxID=329726 RepID=B0CCI8_ACAM1|nr:DUF29 domain-containing protein [Acaryochloris marina]ABW28017.1 conserved hypothetical protein [Acaryochloris marina MBIC11017]BDM82730.1 hypothetical protein AM10699_55910 [Acaryochloris marina MBIC10699]